MKKRSFRYALFIIAAVALALPASADTDNPSVRPPVAEKPPVQEAPAGEDTAVERPFEYVIGAGDVLAISVWKTQELTTETAVLPDGAITFPLIGTITAEGKTIGQLKDELSEKLRVYVTDPVVTLVVRATQSQQIYVIGKVLQPGRFLITSQVDVLQALAMAGGPNAYADKDDIRIFRKEGNRTIIYPFNYEKVSRGKDLDQNIVLMRGDVIVVP